MNKRSLLNKLGKRYPKKLQEWYDHCGKQTGENKTTEIKKVVLALDYNMKVFEYAKEIQPDLIITHHPFIFGTYKKVLNRDPIKNMVNNLTLQYLHCDVYSYHTCFDNALNGMNDALTEALELKNVRGAKEVKDPAIRIGDLPYEMSLVELSKYIKEKLNVSYALLMTNNKDKRVKNMAIVGGGASGYYMDAYNEGADVYVSGDCAHHTRREVLDMDYNYIDIPHECEKIFLKKMKEVLEEIDPSLEIYPYYDQKEALVI